MLNLSITSYGRISMDVLDQFKNFLIKQGALESYFKNLKNERFSTSELAPFEFITGAFTWSCTVESDLYWNDLDTIWQKETPRTLEEYSVSDIIEKLELSEEEYWED